MTRAFGEPRSYIIAVSGSPEAVSEICTAAKRWEAIASALPTIEIPPELQDPAKAHNAEHYLKIMTNMRGLGMVALRGYANKGLQYRRDVLGRADGLIITNPATIEVPLLTYGHGSRLQTVPNGLTPENRLSLETALARSIPVIMSHTPQVETDVALHPFALFDAGVISLDTRGTDDFVENALQTLYNQMELAAT